MKFTIEAMEKAEKRDAAEKAEKAAQKTEESEESADAADDDQYTFKVHNGNVQRITKLLASEDGKNYINFDIGKGIEWPYRSRRDNVVTAGARDERSHARIGRAELLVSMLVIHKRTSVSKMTNVECRINDE